MSDPSGDMCQARMQNPNCTVCNLAIGCSKIHTSINKEQMCSQTGDAGPRVLCCPLVHRNAVQ